MKNMLENRRMYRTWKIFLKKSRQLTAQNKQVSHEQLMKLITKRGKKKKNKLTLVDHSDHQHPQRKVHLLFPQ